MKLFKRKKPVHVIENVRGMELTEAAGIATACTEPEPESDGWITWWPKVNPWGEVK